MNYEYLATLSSIFMLRYCIHPWGIKVKFLYPYGVRFGSTFTKMLNCQIFLNTLPGLHQNAR